MLYETAREFILGDDKDSLNGKTVYDLYSGTGTIAQLMAPVCKEVVGVEIVEEAVAQQRKMQLLMVLITVNLSQVMSSRCLMR